jgi:hypothetical protein
MKVPTWNMYVKAVLVLVDHIYSNILYTYIGSLLSASRSDIFRDFVRRLRCLVGRSLPAPVPADADALYTPTSYTQYSFYVR